MLGRRTTRLLGTVLGHSFYRSMLDQADTAVRALYRQLADNPDLATEHGDGLRELQRKQLCLYARHESDHAIRWRGVRVPSPLQLLAISLLGLSGCYSTWDVSPRKLTSLQGYRAPAAVTVTDAWGESVEVDEDTRLRFLRNGHEPEDHRFSSIERADESVLIGVEAGYGDSQRRGDRCGSGRGGVGSE